MTNASDPTQEQAETPARSGCLSIPLRLIQALAAGDSSDAPAQSSASFDAYHLRPTLHTPGGRALFGVLQGLIPEGHVVVPEVPFIGLFNVKGKTWRAAQNKIIQKRVDFVIYEAASMKPVCAIELDDASHDAPDRRARDVFTDGLFRHVGLPLVHVKAASSYDASEVARTLATALRPQGKATRGN